MPPCSLLLSKGQLADSFLTRNLLHQDWYRTFYPQLKDVAVECVQEPGEMLYVP